MDGALFLKQYLPRLDKDTPRLLTVYKPIVTEMLSDEEIYIRIEAIEIATDLLKYLDKTVIETNFIPEI
jgi:hypothetical protein